MVFIIFCSNFKINFWKQTVENLIRRHVLIWFCTVCRCPTKRHLHQRRFRRIYLSTNPSPHDPQNLVLAQTNRPMKTPGRIFFDNPFLPIRGRLDLAVLFTPSTPNRQNRNQVRWNICAGVLRSTPSFEVV